MIPNPSREDPSAGRPWRESVLAELDSFIAARRSEADAYRDSRSSLLPPNELRRIIQASLGWPLDEYQPSRPALAEETLVQEDSLGKIFRLRIGTLPGLNTYALLCLPPGPGPFPAVMAQHGGRGTPEMLMGLTGNSANYRDFGHRLRSRGFAVLAPQLCLFWGESWGPERDQSGIENSLRHLGGSLAALETVRLRRCLNYLSARPDIDGGRIGMAGLSYGGFYTLLTAALDERIRVAYSSCFLNRRYQYPWADLVWKGSAFHFLDAELASLIAPRPLYADIGRDDEVFLSEGVENVASEISDHYQRQAHPENFVFHTHPGGHEFDPESAPLDFIQSHLAPDQRTSA